MRARPQALWWAGLVALGAVAVDQLTKALARANIEPGENVDLVAGLQLVQVRNDGVAFGLLGGAGPALIALGAAAFTVLLVYFLTSSDRDGLWLPVGLIAGGAIGNLIDRIAEGAVTDFIDPPRWPAFNVADVEITAGVILLALIYMREPEAEPAGQEGTEARSEAGSG